MGINKNNSRDSKRPDISIIIPLGPNRKLYALESLKRQKANVQVIVKEGTNPSKNRNDGLKEAKSSIVAFIDAHSILPSDWAKKVISFFKNNQDVDILGGPQLTPKDQNFFGRVTGYALSSIFGSAGVSNRYSQKEVDSNADERYVSSSNMACRSKVSNEIKFDENLYPGEDPKFISDAKSKGFKVAYVPDIFVYHRRRENLAGFVKQIFYYGYTRPQKEGIIQTIKKPSFLVPSLFLIYMILFGSLSLISFHFMLPLIFYIILSITFSIYEAIKNGELKAIFILPIIFFSIHLAYGLGFLGGVIKKIL